MADEPHSHSCLVVFSQRVFLNFSFLRKEKKSLFLSMAALQGSVKALYIALQPPLDERCAIGPWGGLLRNVEGEQRTPAML